MSAAPPSWSIRLVDVLHRRARWLVLGLVAVTLGLGVFATRIEVDNSLQVWFVEGDPALAAYDHYKEVFGNDELVIIAATAPEGIYDKRYLTRVRAASQGLEALPYVRRVESLAVSLHATNEAGDIVVGPLLPESGDIGDADVALVKSRIAADPSFQGVLVGATDQVSLIVVEPRATPDFERKRKAVLDGIGAVVDRELRKDGGTAHLGGMGVVYEGLNQASLRDSGLFISLSYVILLAGLWVIFRRVVWVFLGGAIVGVSVMATLGIAGLLGRDMNMVTAIVPTLIMTVGVLDLVHLLDAYDEGRLENPKATVAQILRGSVALTIVPCVVNSVTDTIGFASFVTAPVGAIRDLGWLVSIGLLILVVAVLIIGVPALARWGGRSAAHAAAEANPDGRLVTRAVLAMSRFAVERRAAVLVGTAVLVAVAIVGMSRLRADTYTIGFLPKDHVVRRDHFAIERTFGQFMPYEFTVKTRGDQRITDPEVLRRIDATERAFEDHPKVDKTTGLVDIVKQVHRVYMEDAAAYAVPAKREAVTQLLDTTYAQSDTAEDNLNALLDDRHAPHMTHLTARSGWPNASEVAKVLDDLAARARTTGGPELAIEPAGYLPLYVRIIQHITDAQISSALSAFLLVTLVMMLLLRSIKLGLLAMVPNLVPALFTLGLMGFTGIPLDLATVLIAGIVIGISVNDTSHLMFRFRQELSATPDDARSAVERMMRTTGRAVVLGSLTLIAGFGVLLAASVRSIFYFGLLTTITTIAALLADLVITPALLVATAAGRRRGNPTAVP